MFDLFYKYKFLRENTNMLPYRTCLLVYCSANNWFMQSDFLL